MISPGDLVYRFKKPGKLSKGKVVTSDVGLVIRELPSDNQKGYVKQVQVKFLKDAKPLWFYHYDLRKVEVTSQINEKQ
jgi:hypothetical protein